MSQFGDRVATGNRGWKPSSTAKEPMTYRKAPQETEPSASRTRAEKPGWRVRWRQEAQWRMQLHGLSVGLQQISGGCCRAGTENPAAVSGNSQDSPVHRPTAYVTGLARRDWQGGTKLQSQSGSSAGAQNPVRATENKTILQVLALEHRGRFRVNPVSRGRGDQAES